jgi:hypothetical protein
MSTMRRSSAPNGKVSGREPDRGDPRARLTATRSASVAGATIADVGGEASILHADVDSFYASVE